MEVHVPFDVVPAGNGVLARAEQVNLAAFGSYNEEAITALARGISAWCAGLQKVGVLQDVLARRGLEWEGDLEGTVRVIPVVAA
jgi:hypothetical protein